MSRDPCIECVRLGFKRLALVGSNYCGPHQPKKTMKKTKKMKMKKKMKKKAG